MCVTIASGGVIFYLYKEDHCTVCAFCVRGCGQNLGTATAGLPHAYMARTREAVGSQAPRAHSSGEGGKGHENHQRVGDQQLVCTSMHATWNDMRGLAM